MMLIMSLAPIKVVNTRGVSKKVVHVYDDVDIKECSRKIVSTNEEYMMK